MLVIYTIALGTKLVSYLLRCSFTICDIKRFLSLPYDFLYVARILHEKLKEVSVHDEKES